MRYHLQRCQSRVIPFADNLTAPESTCPRPPVRVLDEDGEPVALIIKTLVDGERQREKLSQFCRTLNQLGVGLLYQTRSVRVKQREKGLLILTINACDRAALQSAIDRLG